MLASLELMGNRLAVTLALTFMLAMFLLAWCNDIALPAEAVSGGVISSPLTPTPPTFNFSTTITKGGTFQTVLVPAKSFTRRYIFIQNNNTFLRQCWVFLGDGAPRKEISFLLRQGQSREWHTPFAPIGEVQATCDRDGDTLYIEAQ